MVDENMLQLLKSSHKSDVETTFAGESRFHTATKFKVKSHYAMQFHALRRLYYGGDRKFVESLCHCETWAADGGKSGAGFLKTQVKTENILYLTNVEKCNVGSTLYC